MFYFTLFVIMLFILSAAVFSLSLLFSKKLKFSREKASPFECGFDPNHSNRTAFSLRFFLITIIFLIFDVEVALLLPAVVAYKVTFFHWFSTMFIFLTVLIFGLIHEWKEGALEWSN